MGAPSLHYPVCGELPLILSRPHMSDTQLYHTVSPANSGMLRKYG